MHPVVSFFSRFSTASFVWTLHCPTFDNLFIFSSLVLEGILRLELLGRLCKGVLQQTASLNRGLLALQTLFIQVSCTPNKSLVSKLEARSSGWETHTGITCRYICVQYRQLSNEWLSKCAIIFLATGSQCCYM